jgi:hypothetical protein
MKKYLIPLIILLFTCNSWAATYYVSFTDGNDACNGSSKTAYNASTNPTNCPIKYAPGMSGEANAVTLYSGDTVILKGGDTWTFTSTMDNMWTIGTAGITIQGGQQLGTPWGTGLPVLDATGNTSSQRAGIYIDGKSNVTVDGLKIYNTEYSPSGGSGMFIIGVIQNLEIKNCFLDKTGDQSFRVGPSNGSSHLLFHGNTTSNSGRFFFAVADSAVVDDVQIYDNTFLGTGNWIGGSAGSLCTAEDTPNLCCVGASDTEAQRAANSVACRSTQAASCTGVKTPEGCCLYANDTDAHIIANAQSCAVHGDGIMMGAACTASNSCLTNIKIHHNKFSGDWSTGATALIFLQNGSASGATQYGGNHIEIYDNQLAMDTDGILGSYIQVWSLWNDLKIYNNTMDGLLTGSHPNPHCIAFTHATTNALIKNNILSGCTNGVTFSDTTTAGSATLDYNLYATGITRFIYGSSTNPSNDCRNLTDCRAAPFSQEAHGVTGDPKFTTAPTGSNSGDWTLQEGSPASNVGLDLSASFTTDLLGNARPTGANTWDMGAYEYGASGDETAPTITSFTIGALGTSGVMAFSESVTVADGSGFTLDCNGGTGEAISYTSGSPGNSITFSITGRTIATGETCTLDYATVTNGIQDAAGNDLATIGDPMAVTNSSEYTPTETTYIITVQSTGNCIVSPISNQVIPTGDTKAFTCTEVGNSGCAAWTGTCTGTGTTSFTTAEITGNCTVVQGCYKINADAKMGTGSGHVVGSGAGHIIR